MKITRFRIFAAALLLGLISPVFTGCGGGGGGGNGGGTPTGTTTTGTTGTTGPPAPTLSISTPTGTGLAAILSENQATVGVGGPEVYTLALSNTSSAAITVNATLNGATLVPPSSLQIVNSAGVIVYPTEQPLNTPPPPPIGNTVTLQPGQSFSQTISVAAFGAAGPYNATASFQIVQSPSTATQTVRSGPLQVTAQ